jgi:S-adenosylmethionine decarboxylase
MNTKQRVIGQDTVSDSDEPHSSDDVNGYGPHLTYDGYDADPTLLNNMQVVFEFLLKLPAIIGMNRLTQPYVISYDGAEKPNDYGVTGIVIIATSHISIHTYPYDKTFFLDIFSCKGFDREKALTFVRETFKVKQEEVELVVRGKRFRQK